MGLILTVVFDALGRGLMLSVVFVAICRGSDVNCCICCVVS